MTTAYTTLLGLALPVQGELQGTWGDEVNNYITNYLDAAVAGTQTISGSQTAVTLSKTTGSSLSQAGSGATGSSQYFVINCTGNPAGTLTITAPAASKVYLIINATSTTQDVKIVGAGPTTGVTLVSGERAIVSWNGSDFVKVANFGGVGSFTTISATTGNITTVNATTVDTTNLEVTNIKAKDGTASMTLADSTGVASFSANPVFSGGTANGVLYLDGSKVATSGSALTFDGTTLVSGSSGTTTKLILQGGAQTSMAIKSSTGTSGFLIGRGYASDDANSFFLYDLATSQNRFYIDTTPNIFQYATAHVWNNAANSTEYMRLTSTGLGIGTSSPGQKLHVNGNIRVEGATSEIFMAVGAERTISASGSAATTALTFKRWNGSSYVNDVVMDGSGNLGLGVTPSAWNANNKSIIQLQNTANLFTRSTGLFATSNFVYNSADTGVFQANGYGLVYQQNQTAGTHVWLNTPNNTSGAGATASLTSAMTLDASGNLGVGTTSISCRGDFRGSSGLGVQFLETSSGNSTRVQLGTSSGVGYINADAGSGSIALGFNVGATERARITSGGDFVVGNTSALVTAANRGNVTINGSTSSIVALGVGGTATASFYADASVVNVSARTNIPLLLSTNDTERARITSGGFFKASNNGSYDNSAGLYHELDSDQDSHAVYIKATNASLSTTGIVQLGVSRNTTNNSFYALSYYNSGAAAYKFRVADSGDVTNTNGTYGTISDAKMKTDIVDAGSQWADIKAIRFRKFKMKNDPTGLLQLGVVAQELEQTSPGLVDEHIDRDGEGNDLGTTTKSVKTSVLLMKAAVALQEAMARIEQLEARVAALEKP